MKFMRERDVIILLLLLLPSSIKRLFVRNLELPVVDLVDDVVRCLAVDGATDGLSGAQNLLDGALQLTRHRSLLHDAGDVDNFFEGDVSAMFDVLDLLAVTRRFFESANEKSGSAGNDAHRRLTILDRQFDGNTETLPVLSCFGDIITDLLGRQSQWADLGSEGGGGTDFTSDGSQAYDFNFSGIEFGRHFFSLLTSLSLSRSKR